ncbi:MAG: Crp/Fnr family transcriptional regulator [Gemmatimonadetes bacterium]|nr:Crp/Fnr family transcriptional regulator [Gemmatimonadota bacterium]
MTLPAEALADCRLFRDLPGPALQTLAEAVRHVRFGRGERLIPMGQRPDRLLVIRQGLVKLAGVSARGIERILYVSRPGDVVGQGVLLDGYAPDYEVAAMTPVRALAIGRRELLRVGRSQPVVILSLAREVARMMKAMTERVMAATTADVPARLSQLLLEFADLPDGTGQAPLGYPLTHELMAQIVGASRPHTSTVLGALEAAGAVRRRPSGLLLNPPRLREIAEGGLGAQNGREILLAAS